VIYRQAILALSEGDISGADEFIRKYISILQVSSSSETAIKTGLAEIYSEAGMFDKAEEYYRQALALQPDDPDRLNDLATFLIENDRNIDEGLILGDKALELNPDNFLYYESKGWGLFKQGKYEDALVSLEKADSLKPLYTHSIYLHLEEVKKAIDKQKSN
jgi:Tfp pilus assembly protein PilF